MSCNACVMRRACYAEKTGGWEGFKGAFRDKGEISEWAFAGVGEAYEKVASEDVGRLSVAHDILRKSTDFLSRILSPASGVGSVTLSCVCPYCTCFLWRITHGVCVIGAWRRQQQTEVTVQLVCSLWRSIRLESGQQAAGDTTQCQCT